MRRTTTLLGLALLLAAPLAADDKKATDLEGSWEAIGYMREGKDLTAPGGKGPVLTIEGRKYQMSRDGEKFANGTFTINTKGKPAEIDIVSDTGENKGKTVKGIYAIKDSTLRVCIAAAEKDRPTEFAAKEGSGHTLVTYKRVKK